MIGVRPAIRINGYSRSRPRRKRLPKGRLLTVCIAAACDSGQRVITATDGLLTLGAVSADVMLAKMYWQNDWLYLYAGTPANTKMIFEGMWQIHQKGKAGRGKGRARTDTSALTRDNIQPLVLAAYRERRAHLASFNVLSPYNMTIDEFKRTGRDRFTPEEFNRLSVAIATEDQNFQEQLLVIGWGKTRHAVMLYEVSPWGTQDHALAGTAAIGTGAEVAQSTMMLLGHSRDSKLGETLYMVAAAKFAAEKSAGEAVGERTSVYVTWKRRPEDSIGVPPAIPVPDEQVQRLRDVWLTHGRPKIPEQAWRTAIPRALESMGFPNEISGSRLEELLSSGSQKDQQS